MVLTLVPKSARQVPLKLRMDSEDSKRRRGGVSVKLRFWISLVRKMGQWMLIMRGRGRNDETRRGMHLRVAFSNKASEAHHHTSITITISICACHHREVISTPFQLPPTNYQLHYSPTRTTTSAQKHHHPPLSSSSSSPSRQPHPLPLPSSKTQPACSRA